MILQELLDSLGIDKRQLAKIADISVKSLTRMQDDVEQYVLDAVDDYRHSGALAEVIPTPGSHTLQETPQEPVTDTLPVTHRNIALSRTWHELDRIAVARTFNLSVFDYNKAVQGAVKYCRDKSTSFAELRYGRPHEK